MERERKHLDVIDRLLRIARKLQLIEKSLFFQVHELNIILIPRQQKVLVHLGEAAKKALRDFDPCEYGS